LEHVKNKKMQEEVSPHLVVQLVPISEININVSAEYAVKPKKGVC